MTIELLTPFTKVELEPEIKEKTRKQVDFSGGNFNPVQCPSHCVADQVRQQLGLDHSSFAWIPTSSHVDKRNHPSEHYRLKMLVGNWGDWRPSVIDPRVGAQGYFLHLRHTINLLTATSRYVFYYFIRLADMVVSA